MQNPFFSIVIPTYNRAELIGATIQSLLGQNYLNYEILVIDDGSTDNTESVVCSIKNERLFYFKKDNAERAAARNYGALKAKGDYINFFDSDDLALPNHLEEAAKLIMLQKDPEWFHLGYAWATPDSKVFRVVNNFTGPTLNDILPLGNPLSCNGVFIRADVIRENAFNEERDLSASEDYELWLRLGARYPLYYSNVVTSWVIDHEGRSVRKINAEKLIKRLGCFLKFTADDKQIMNKYSNHYSYLKMDCNSYIAVHLAHMPAYKLKSILYLYKSLFNNIRLLKTRRFYATIKNLITKW